MVRYQDHVKKTKTYRQPAEGLQMTWTMMIELHELETSSLLSSCTEVHTLALHLEIYVKPNNSYRADRHSVPANIHTVCQASK